ncbi:hypothetical protein O9929_05185 [Vibrio lentus]|nr:hypothetical protein [Vibrio lentus]
MATYSLTTRVEIDGKRGDFKKPSSCIAEYEVPENAWYFDENSHQTLMPYSVLMEFHCNRWLHLRLHGHNTGLW